jgi:hypothetical protein
MTDDQHAYKYITKDVSIGDRVVIDTGVSGRQGASFGVVTKKTTRTIDIQLSKKGSTSIHSGPCGYEDDTFPVWDKNSDTIKAWLNKEGTYRWKDSIGLHHDVLEFNPEEKYKSTAYY